MFKRIDNLLFHEMPLHVHNSTDVFQVESAIHNHRVEDPLLQRQRIKHFFLQTS